MSNGTIAAPDNGEKRPLTIKDHLNSPGLKAEIARALPAHCKPDRMMRVAITALTKTPKLAQCDQASFFQALLSLSQLGLEPDGRRAHLIPFENRKRGIVECQLIIDYKGLVELAYRSGAVKSIHADIVREGDEFEYSVGRVVRHTPWFLRRDAEKPATAGKMVAAYCAVTIAGGAEKHEVMSKEQIDGIRARSKSGNSGPWVTDYDEMAKKTVFRRCSKWLPLSAEILEALDKDDDVIEHARPAPVQSLSSITEALLAGPPETDGDTIDEPQGTAEEAPQQSPEDGEPINYAARFADCRRITDVTDLKSALKSTHPNDLALIENAAAARLKEIKDNRGSNAGV